MENSQNWFKTIIAIAVLIVACSVGYYFVIYLPKQSEKNQAYKSDIDSQQKCADRALWFFKQEGYGDSANDTYFDHWNKSLGKCFILIQSISENGKTDVTWTQTEDKTLIDAFSAQAYGEILIRKHLGDIYGVVSNCSMTKDWTNTGSKSCNIEAEFDNYVKSYMEQ